MTLEVKLLIKDKGKVETFDMDFDSKYDAIFNELYRENFLSYSIELFNELIDRLCYRVIHEITRNDNYTLQTVKREDVDLLVIRNDLIKLQNK